MPQIRIISEQAQPKEVFRGVEITDSFDPYLEYYRNLPPVILVDDDVATGDLLNLTASAGNGYVTLNWDVVELAISYNLYRATTQMSGQYSIELKGEAKSSQVVLTWTLIEIGAPLNDNDFSLLTNTWGATYTDITVTNGTNYFYKVIAYGVDGELVATSQVVRGTPN